jgi:pseudooxynicotine oxidase
MARSKKDSVESNSKDGISRRSMLGGMAAIGGATAVGATMQGCSPEKTSSGPLDVIVIGGGFAGCVTARDLSHRGHKVTLLEAQGRLGGRSFTSEFAGKIYEVGALLLSWKEPFLWAEVTRYDMEIEPVVGMLAPEHCYWIADGKTHDGPPEEFFDIYVPPIEKFFEDVAEVFPYPYDPMANRETVEKLDQFSVMDRLKTFATQQERDLADNWAAVPLARASKDVGLAASLALTSAFGGVQSSLEGASYRLKKGTSALVKKIAEDGDFEIQLQSPVASITQTDAGVKVKIEGGETLEAAMVVVTAPVNTYENIEFSPALSSEKLTVSKGNMAGGQGAHVNARLKGKLPPLLAVAPSDRPLHLLLTTDILEDSVIVDAYGPDATMFDGTDPEAVQKVIRQWIPDVEVMETVSYRWDLDPYSQGTWCGFGPGVLSKYYDALREPEGNIYFASADSATAFRGFMEGAVESGVRVAAEVHRLLKARKTV